jgi:predicted nuclease of restriction endonuclease-like (RecB) superfamily
MIDLVGNNDYRQWIVSVMERIQSSQIKAAIAVSHELLELYWYIGEQILEKQQSAKWGDGFLEQMSRDLLAEFPDMMGFSHRNLKSIRQWLRFWTGEGAIGKQLVSQSEAKGKQHDSQILTEARSLVSQIPWGHNILIFQKLRSPADALFYVQKTIENNWSRTVHTHQFTKRCLIY